jgi:hypothetical protein
MPTDKSTTSFSITITKFSTISQPNLSPYDSAFFSTNKSTNQTTIYITIFAAAFGAINHPLRTTI